MALEAFDRLYTDGASNTRVWAALGRAEAGKDADAQLEELWGSLGTRKTDQGLREAIYLTLQTSGDPPLCKACPLVKLNYRNG